VFKNEWDFSLPFILGLGGFFYYLKGEFIMEAFKKFNQAYRSHLSWIVIGCAIIALIFPSLFAWSANYVTLLLQFIMFTMGLTMTPSDFGSVLKKPWKIILIGSLQYLFMPLSAFLLAQAFQLPSEMALGLILVGSVPGGTSSNVITYLANGNVPLSIGATSISTLLSPILTPIMLSFYGGTYLNIEFRPMFLSILNVVLLPIVLGLVMSYFFANKTQKVEDILPTLSSTAVLLVLASTVAINQQTLLSTGLIMFVAVALHNLSGYMVGYLFSKLFKMDTKSTRAIATEVGLQNTGLSASLGLAHFSPLAALAGAAGTVVHTLFGSIYASICDKNDKGRMPILTQSRHIKGGRQSTKN